MELLVPGFFVLLFAIVMVFLIVPRFGPTITLLLCGVALTVGMYHHYSLFYHEYRLATWAEKLRTYGPGVIITALIIFILGFIFTLFGGPAVPIPNMSAPADNEGSEPPISIFGSNNNSQSAINTVTNTLSESVNTAKEAVGEGLNAIANTASRGFNAVRNAVPVSFFEQV